MFQSGVKRALTTAMPSSVGVVIVVLSAIVVYRLRVKLYARWKFHPFDRDECLDEDMGFDVFLSCHSDDNLPHGNDIRVQLEQRGYRVCYLPEIFLPAIQSAKTSTTPSYAANEQCVFLQRIFFKGLTNF